MRGNASLDLSWARSWAAVLIAHLGREYPNKVSHELTGDADVAPPRALTPVFYGCYDWVGSSRVDLQACKLEYSIVSPK